MIDLSIVIHNNSGRKPLPLQCVRTFTAHTGPVHIAKYNSTGEYVLSAGQDKLIRLWNPETGLNIKTYSGHGKEILDISIDHTRFVSCGGDQQVFYWDVSTGRTISRFDGHSQRINSVDFNFDGSVIASARSRSPIQILSEAKDSITSLLVKDYEIVAGSTDGNIMIYDLRMGALLTDYISHPVTSVTLSSDNNYILASSLDSVIRLMDKEDGHKNSTYKIHSCLSNDDSRIISGSEDGSIYIWDLLDGNLLKTIEAHSGIVTYVTYHPRIDGMLSSSIDGLVKVWKP
ncbi:13544_t:CDS:2 [Entrophospora sp. SA101]|nr:13544_t:CDS:2 [Entrophospora sp. SA101]